MVSLKYKLNDQGGGEVEAQENYHDVYWMI